MRANAFHPGLVRSELMQEAPRPVRIISRLVSRSAERSAHDLVDFTELKADAPGVVTAVGPSAREVVQAGQMIVRTTPVTFCLNLNWRDSEGSESALVPTYKHAVADILNRIKQRIQEAPG